MREGPGLRDSDLLEDCARPAVKQAGYFLWIRKTLVQWGYMRAFKQQKWNEQLDVVIHKQAVVSVGGVEVSTAKQHEAGCIRSALVRASWARALMRAV